MEHTDQETGEITPAFLPIRNANPWTRVRVAKHFPLPSLAKQSFKDECNINTIMGKYDKTGLIEHLNTHQGQYGDFVGFQDYQTSLNQILEADEMFMSIPSKIRSRFQNDPEKFLQFAQDPENLDQMIEMGLARPKPPEPAKGGTPPEGGRPPASAETTPGEAAAAVAAASTPG